MKIVDYVTAATISFFVACIWYAMTIAVCEILDMAGFAMKVPLAGWPMWVAIFVFVVVLAVILLFDNALQGVE